MIFKNKDIRIVNLSINKVTDIVAHYLEEKKFSVKDNEIFSKNIFIRATNKLRSSFKLLITAEPQIFQCNLLKENKNQTKIEIKFDLFRNFRLLIYGLLSVFMISSRICMEIGMISQKDFTFLRGMFLFSSIGFIISSVLLVCKIVDLNYAVFVESFYSRIKKITHAKEIILQKAEAPEIFRISSFFVLLVVVVFNNLILKKSHEIITNYNINLTMSFCLVLVLLLITFVLVMIFRRESMNRMLFTMAGISVAVAICYYSNIPIIYTEQALSSVQKMEKNKLLTLEKYEKDLSQLNLKPFNISKINKEKQRYIRNYRRRFLFLFFTLLISPLIIAMLIIYFFSPINIIKEFDLYKTEDNRSVYYKSLQPLSSHSLLSFFVLLIWGLISMGVITGIFIIFTIVGQLVLSNYYQGSGIGNSFIEYITTGLGYLLDRLFTTAQIKIISKATILCYCMPIIIIVFLVIEKNIRAIAKILFLLHKTDHVYHIEKDIVRQKLIKICNFTQIKVPLIAIKKADIINASAKYYIIPLFRNVVEITTKAIRSLESSELEALLAHEVGHLKNNTSIKFMILNFLSDWTLFGNGFLAVIQNSIKIENEADAFATKWLEDGSEKKIGKRALIRLLEKQEKIRMSSMLNQIKFESIDNNTLSYYTTDWPSPELKKDIDSYAQKKWIDKIRISIKVFYELYFSEKIVSYFHPTYEERLSVIQSK